MMKKEYTTFKKRIASMLLLVVLLVAWVPCATHAATQEPLVDVVMTANGITNAGSEEGATLAIGGAPTFGEFLSENMTKTTYFQMAEADMTDKIGFVGDTRNNCISVTSPTINAAKAGTLTFWVNQDVPIQNNAWGGNCYLDYKSADASLFNLQPSYGDNSRFTLAGHEDNFSIYATRPYWYQISVAWHYDETAALWKARVYYDGGSEKSYENASAVDVSDMLLQFGFGFPGRMSAIKVYEGALSKEDISALHTAEKDNYKEIVETETEMRLVFPNANGVLSDKGGKLTLTFNSIPDANTLSGITLVKNGGEDNLITDAEVDIAGKKVILTYGAPDAGASYVLTVDGVQSITELTMTAPKSYTFTVVTELAVELDFSADGVTNIGSDTSAAIYLEETPTYGKFLNTNWTTTDYMQFGVPDGEGGYVSGNTSNLKVVSPAMRNQNQTTYSFWCHFDVRPQSSTYFYKTFMGYTDGTNVLAGYNTNRADIVRMLTEGDVYDYTLPGNEWVHYAFVRSYNEATSEMTIDLYLNGYNVKTMKKVIEDRPDESNFYFNFGAGIPGKISGVKLYTAAKTKDDIKTLYDAEVINYTKLEGEESMSLTSVTPDTETLPTSGGEITLTFNDYVDAETIDGITLTRTDGTALPGKILVSLPEAISKTVNIKFGDLPEGTIKLTVPAGIASLNGYATEEESVREYTTVYQASVPRVLDKEVLSENGQVKMYFSSDMDAESMETAEVSYTAASGRKTSATFVGYDEAERAAIFEPNDYPTYGEKYTISLKGIRTSAGEALPDTTTVAVAMPEYPVQATVPVFTNAEGKTVTALAKAEGVQAQVTLTNSSGAERTVAVILLHADATGRLKSVKRVEKAVAAKGSMPISTAVSTQKYVAGDSIRLMIWDDPALGAKPVLLTPVILPYTAE